MMKKLLKLKPLWALLLYAFLDTICVGMGMGVPFFNILFGFVAGWFVVSWIAPGEPDTGRALGKAFRYAALTSSLTLLEMAIIWGRTIPLLFDPTADLANFGIPMILYEPRASFIGWQVLMILLSPFLQFLMTVLASVVTLLWRLRREVVHS